MPLQVLHVGCGVDRIAKKHRYFSAPKWREVRLDLDPGCKPDVVASITSMPMVEASSYDAVFSSHNLEHLYPHEVPRALLEFRRVLKPSGFVLICCPDLQVIAEQIVAGNFEKEAYTSPAGPIYPIDMLFGLRSEVASGNLFMAHRTAFTIHSLIRAMRRARFAQVGAAREVRYRNLWAIGFATEQPHVRIDELQRLVFPKHLAIPPADTVFKK